MLKWNIEGHDRHARGERVLSFYFLHLLFGFILFFLILFFMSRDYSALNFSFSGAFQKLCSQSDPPFPEKAGTGDF